MKFEMSTKLWFITLLDKLIAGCITESLNNTENATVQDEISSTIKAMCSQLPLFKYV